jgi:hemerythrin-like metal-binding protein
MAIIEWNQINSVNVKELDKQHKKLINLINQLFKIKEKKKNIQKEFLKTLKELKNYANYHFNAEEKYFDLYDYPEKEQHKKQHQSYKNKIIEISKKNKESEIEIIIEEILNFLGKWWIMHVNNSDMKYSDFFNLKGLY